MKKTARRTSFFQKAGPFFFSFRKQRSSRYTHGGSRCLRRKNTFFFYGGAGTVARSSSTGGYKQTVYSKNPLYLRSAERQTDAFVCLFVSDNNNSTQSIYADDSVLSENPLLHLSIIYVRIFGKMLACEAQSSKHPSCE